MPTKIKVLFCCVLVTPFLIAVNDTCMQPHAPGPFVVQTKKSKKSVRKQQEEYGQLVATIISTIPDVQMQAASLAHEIATIQKTHIDILTKLVDNELVISRQDLDKKIETATMLLRELQSAAKELKSITARIKNI